MNKQDLLKLCLLSNDAIETYPFKDKAYEKYAVIRHKSNNKWFALIFYLNEKLCINLKVNPYDAVILKDQYKSITSAWHMNKSHWIMVDVNNISIEVLKNLIKISFDLTSSKKS